jgi:hypothetical protein
MTVVNPRRPPLVFLVGLLVLGCNAPRGPFVVTDPDPANKIPAIKKMVRAKDMSSARQLVKDLDSDDPAIRFYAIGGLQRLTGETFGYQYFADEAQRKPALEKWKQWLGAQEKAHDGPATDQSPASVPTAP